MNILMLETRNVEQTKDVRMYICRIYSSRYLDTLLHKVEFGIEYALEKYCFIYTRNKGLRHVRIALRSLLTSED